MKWKTLAIVIIGVALIATLTMAGLLDSSPTTHEVDVVNDDETKHVVNVTVQRGNETVFEGSKTVAPNERWNVTTLKKAGSYRVKVQSEDKRTVETFELPLVEDDRASFTDVRVTKEGKLTVRTYWQQS